MSFLEHAVTGIPGPVIDPRIKTGIQILSTSPIPPEICSAMTLVIRAVADQLQKENRPFGNQSVTCIFSESDYFSVALNSDEIAVCMRIAFYPLGRVAPYIGNDRLYVILAEELCHLIWDIADETLVNFKVLSVLRNLNPSIQMSDLYSEDAVQSCDRYLRDNPAFQM